MALFGVVVGWLLSARTQQKGWEKNSKKEEWRELRSTLERCQQKIKSVKVAVPNLGDMSGEAYDEVREAELEGARVIQDRLFILELLQNNKVKEDWDEIQKLAELPGPSPGMVYDKSNMPPAKTAQSTFSVTTFNARWVAMHSKLVNLARKDLGL
jgi:hypothetical protein